MENLNNELLEKAKQAKSVEELEALAKGNGVELTEEQAKTVYARLHPASGELPDDELDNVAGGGCGGSSAPVYECPNCHSSNLFARPGASSIICIDCGYMAGTDAFKKK